MTHDLKTVQPFFDAVASGAKRVEIRKADRPFKVGDTLRLRLWAPYTYIGPEVLREITHVLTHADFPEGIQSGYVALSLRVPDDGSDRQREQIQQLADCLVPVTFGLAEAELVGEPIADDDVVLSFMGSGASATVTAGQIRTALRGEAR